MSSSILPAASETKPSLKDGAHNRRSGRVLLQLPIVISGLRLDGASFEARGETLQVNAHGAKISTRAPLVEGMQVRIVVERPYRAKDARVVWTSEEQEFGIEFAEPGNFWGVYFPPSDWNNCAPLEDDAQGSPRKGSAEASDEISPGAQEEVGSKAAPCVSAALKFEGIGDVTEVVVAGMAAAHIPFQEKSVLVPISREVGTVLVVPVISAGALLRIVLPDKRTVRARCIGIGRYRVQGKWKVWLNYES